MIFSELQREDCVAKVVPVDDYLGRPHTADKPYDHKSRDARGVLLYGQQISASVSERS